MAAKCSVVAAAAIALCAACGDSSDGPGGATGGSGTSTDTSTTGGGAGGGGTTSTTTTGFGGFTGDSVTLTMEPFVVPSGGEVYKCQDFANPFGGADAEVAAFESHMTPGSHHLLLFYKSGATDGPIEDCSGLEFAATPYSTQLPDDAVEFPPGVAVLVNPSTGLRMQSHYLNVTGGDLTANVSITFHLAESGTVTAHAGVLFVVEPQIFVPPNQTAVVQHDCSIPFDMNLTKGASHMHKHGTSFEATIDGAVVYQTTTWDEPAPALWDPPKAVKGGDPLHFACSFKNDSSSPLTFGESAESNEMCIFVASFFPVPDGSVTVDCN